MTDSKEVFIEKIRMRADMLRRHGLTEKPMKKMPIKKSSSDWNKGKHSNKASFLGA